MSKSIPVARSQNFLETLGPRKPTWIKFLEFEFFLPENIKLEILPGKKPSWAHIISIHKSNYEIIGKIVK